MIYSLVIPDKIPLSQNRRHLTHAPSGLTYMDRYRNFLTSAFRTKYPTATSLAYKLYGKVFWIHKTGDSFFNRRDADNFSKPLWDALNTQVYNDDEQIRFRQSAKLQHGDSGSLTVNVTHMSDADYRQFLSFHLDPTNTDKNWLYIEVGRFKHSHIKFGEQ